MNVVIWRKPFFSNQTLFMVCTFTRQWALLTDGAATFLWEHMLQKSLLKTKAPPWLTPTNCLFKLELGPFFELSPLWQLGMKFRSICVWKKTKIFFWKNNISYRQTWWNLPDCTRLNWTRILKMMPFILKTSSGKKV